MSGLTYQVTYNGNNVELRIGKKPTTETSQTTSTPPSTSTSTSNVISSIISSSPTLDALDLKGLAQQLVSLHYQKPKDVDLECRLTGCELCGSQNSQQFKTGKKGWKQKLVLAFVTIQKASGKDWLSLSKDIYPFFEVTVHWEIMWPQVKKETYSNWRKKLQDSLSHNKDLFESGTTHFGRKGYWRLTESFLNSAAGAGVKSSVAAAAAAASVAAPAAPTTPLNASAPATTTPAATISHPIVITKQISSPALLTSVSAPTTSVELRTTTILRELPPPAKLTTEEKNTIKRELSGNSPTPTFSRKRIKSLDLTPSEIDKLSLHDNPNARFLGYRKSFATSLPSLPNPFAKDSPSLQRFNIRTTSMPQLAIPADWTVEPQSRPFNSLGADTTLARDFVSYLQRKEIRPTGL